MTTARSAGGPQIEAKDAPVGEGAFPRVRTAEEVFVSPRVVDRVAFEDYAQALRKLLAAATSEGEHLRRTAVEASKSLRAIGEVMPAVDKKLSRAGELVAQLSSKLEAVEAAAKRAEVAADRATTAETRIREMDDRARHRIYEASNAAADEAVARVEAIALKRADELDERGHTLTEFVDRGRADLAETRAKSVEALEKAAGQVKADAARAVEAILSQRQGAQDALAEDHQNATHAIGLARGETVEAIAAERQAAEKALAERVVRLTARVDELVDAAEQRLGQVIEERSQSANERADALAQRIDSAITPKLDESSAAAEAAHARASAAQATARGVFELGLEEIEKLCERAEALLERSGANRATPGEDTLAAIADRAAAAIERMDEVATTGERARRQAEESRKALGESIESAALWLDRLVEQRDGLQHSITLASKLCDQAESQLAQRRDELDEAMRAPAAEVHRHAEALRAIAEQAEARRSALADLIEGAQQQAEAKASAAADKAVHRARVEGEAFDAKLAQAREAFTLLGEQADARRGDLARAIEEAEQRAEQRTTAAADKAAEKAIHKARLEAEKLDAKAMQARQALDQAWKTLESRLKGELKESLSALSAEGQRAERARLALREDIEAARKVEKETRAAISKPASPSSVEQLNRLATLMQDLAERAAPKPGAKPDPKPVTAKPAVQAEAKPPKAVEAAGHPMPAPPAKAPPEKPAPTAGAKKTAKKVAKKVATRKKPGG